MTAAHEHIRNLDLASDEPVKAAYLALTLAATKAGFNVVPTGKGVIRAVKFFLADVQPYSAIVNQKSLLFYLRAPALEADLTSADEAKRRFGGQVLATANSLNEVRIRISNETAAAQLAGWLFTGGYGARRSA